eukprot:7072731-Alexandrium_andersonii.AAC.1
MSASLVGSEMCIRDSPCTGSPKAERRPESLGCARPRAASSRGTRPAVAPRGGWASWRSAEALARALR